MPGTPTAPFIEIFNSIQGEGLWIGRRQTFLRFEACNLDCRYCDTPINQGAPCCRYEAEPGGGGDEAIPNPLTPGRVLDCEARLFERAGGIHSVAATGGEPLAHGPFLAALLPVLRARGRRVLLETNGTLPEALEPLLGWVDIVSMDVKIPFGADGAPGPDVFRRFLDVARRTEAYVKVVAYPGIPDPEWDRAFEVVRSVDPGTPFVIQPVTPWKRVGRAMDPGAILALETRARRLLADVRVIPQAHRIMALP